ncbi:hypothetical protein [Clostridium gasigenes]|uniref:hypothetical protein n=1 Tax=Clostridium gasigenes TaxID=94869 RepID=UPI00162A4ADB|nr:hypothetical protein [Clostridium gasigenes]MBB6625227.1 hypothetical protein [Clostridium gasigenes]MBU3102957.1 hypothetical protein [Clostridium gasigenes]MBU3131560.1 hypothetical protein [Clostridium gasigenes]
MKSEITLDINFRQALIFKHSLEKMIAGKEETINYLEQKDFKSEEEKVKVYKLNKDVHEEVITLNIVKQGLDRLGNERRREVSNYAKNLPKLLEEAERNSKAI